MANPGCLYSYRCAFFSVEAPEIVIQFGNKSITESKEPIGFLLIGLSFALSSTLSLAKLVRDRQDAEYFANQKDVKSDQIATLIKEAHSIYGKAIWVLFIFDVAAFCYSIHRFQMSHERLDLLILGDRKSVV